MKLTNNERSLVVLSLRVAAERYKGNAGTCGDRKLAEIFLKQSCQTLALARRFEEEE